MSSESQRALGFTSAATVDEVLSRLASSRAGLSDAEAATRLTRFGLNCLPRTPPRAWYLELLGNLVHLMAILLWVAASLAWLAGMPELAIAIVAVVLVNGLFSYWQQFQAERAILALEALMPQRVTVRRSGRAIQVPAGEVVPGDVLVLTEGEAIPADARLIGVERLRMDLSTLTGESRPVPRTAAPALVEGPLLASASNLVFAGTTVSTGTGEAVVFATGGETEFGRLARLSQALPQRPSPMQIETQRITRIVTALAVALGAVFFWIGTTMAGLELVGGFLFAIGIIVANVPEGLLPTITLSLAMSVRRMAQRRGLVKRLEKVETLGATTVIVTDKTGTLTENEMTVRQVWMPTAAFRVDGVGYDLSGGFQPEAEGSVAGRRLDELLRTAALCCDAQLSDGRDANHPQPLGDPTELAVLVAAAKRGLCGPALAAWPRLAELPFDSTRKRMTTIHRVEGVPVVCVKGAASEVLARCESVRRSAGRTPLDGDLRDLVGGVHDRLAGSGFRVLAVAEKALETECEWSSIEAEAVECDLTFLGLLALEDPPRPEVKAAVAACRGAGVRVLMATGDDGLTAAAIGREIGLCGSESTPTVVTGADLERMTDAELDVLLAEADPLFARVLPEQKLRLVETLQRRGDVVAVTGDGVNDAPALRRADVGVAMGQTGTDVAREASDLVLADDNFASIVAAIEEGRAIYANVRKFMTYILASNVPELVPFVLFVLFGIPLPLIVMQILAVDLGTDLLPALALGAERPEPDVMRRPPRSRSERLLDARTLWRAYAWLGLMEAALALAAYFFAYVWSGWAPGKELTATGAVYRTATTMSFAGIVACQIGNVFACRSDHESVRASSVRSNPLILLGVASEIALLLLLIYVPVLGRPFGLEPLELAHWAFLAPFPGVIIVLEEARKAVTRRRNRSGNGYAPVSCRDASRPTGGAASRASECDLQSSKDRARGAPPTGTLASPFSRAVECKAFIRASPCGGPIGDRAAATDEATRRPLQRRRVADRGPPRATAPLP